MASKVIKLKYPRMPLLLGTRDQRRKASKVIKRDTILIHTFSKIGDQRRKASKVIKQAYNLFLPNLMTQRSTPKGIKGN